jgi:hypothetical protein
VIYGHCQSSVFLVLNTIWSFWIIAPIICGLFCCG